MQITASQLYAHAAGLKQLFSYKTKKSLDLTRLSTISKGIFDSIPFRERLQRFVVSSYADLASNISSSVLSLRVFDAYYLGEFIKTGQFPKESKFNTIQHFNENATDYSPSAFIEQVERLCKESEANNTALAKFTRKAKSIVELRSDQTNILYDMLMEGKINLITYAYITKVKNVKFDFSKMNITVYRVNKAAEYLSKFDLSQLLKK